MTAVWPFGRCAISGMSRPYAHSWRLRCRCMAASTHLSTTQAVSTWQPLETISARAGTQWWPPTLTGGFLVARECYPLQSMRQHGGAIVNIVADIWGSMPGMGHSGAARAGMVSLTETAAMEWAQSGVRINAVAPGYIASSGMDHYPAGGADAARDGTDRARRGVFGNEAEVSAAIVFCSAQRPALSAAPYCGLMVRGRRCAWAGAKWRRLQPRRQRDAVRPFDGFHRYRTPKVFEA